MYHFGADADGAETMCAWKQGVCGKSLLSAQFYCEPKTALKVYKKKNSAIRQKIIITMYNFLFCLSDKFSLTQEQESFIFVLFSYLSDNKV